MRRLICLMVMAGIASMSTGTAAAATVLKGIRTHEAPDYTRVVLDTSGPSSYKLLTLVNPNRVVIDISNASSVSGIDLDVLASQRDVKNIRIAPRGDNFRVVLDLAQALKPRDFTLQPVAPYGHRLVIDLYGKRAPVKRVMPKRSHERNVIVAIDAGHGGEDPGTIGKGNVVEKTVALSISKEVARLVDATPGFEATLIRSGDHYVALRRRIEIARERRADLFVSIHADDFRLASVSGASVYTLGSKGASSETALWLTEKEKRSDLIGGVGRLSLEDKPPLLRQVLIEMSMEAKRSASIDIAERLVSELSKVTKMHKRQAELANFLVLKALDIPSVLVETGYLSNPDEARKLSQREHQRKIANAIYNGVHSYLTAYPPEGSLLATQEQHSPKNYIISRGDTLSEIANRFGTSSKRIKQVNGMPNDRLFVGQVLLIPSS